MNDELCPACGTRFPLAYKSTGTVGRIEGIRFVRVLPGPRSWRQRARWWLAAHLQDLVNWLAR